MKGGLNMIYRTEHPKPQFMRENWQNLNGIWDFEIDQAKSGLERKQNDPKAEFLRKINVPFCPESSLSGIGHKDFINSVWYKRTINITNEQLQNRIVLHFGAVDYRTIVFVNGNRCFEHKGGYTSFSGDITDNLTVGENTITVWAIDDTRSGAIASGKQSAQYLSYGCYYTRTTGIWQTVWLEFVPKTHIIKTKYVTNIDNSSVTITAHLEGRAKFKAEAFYEGKQMGSAEIDSVGGIETVTINLKEAHLWEVGNGRLYDLKLSYGDDKVNSYFGLRSIKIDGHKFLINNKSVFQRLVLDQGFYPDGIYTAPSDSELLGDIKRSIAMGFNGARLHEKVFEERFLYHCDKMGYIVWGEFANWGLDHTDAANIYRILPEWLEEIDRDFNHPSIIGWCPFNETWNKNGKKQSNELLSTIYNITKLADNTRPCIDTSGNFHVITDIYDLHDYTQEPAEFATHYAEENGAVVVADFRSAYKKEQLNYDGKLPFFISEYGGIRWTDDKSGWGYGDAPQTKEEFLERIKGLTDVLLDNKGMFGFCYTQLTDVEQEQNGLYTYDRRAKFDPETIKIIFSRKAAIED